VNKGKGTETPVFHEDSKLVPNKHKSDMFLQ